MRKKHCLCGDGVNDAPVVALADEGIAMGGLGSDATIETADIVIQNDQPSKIVSAIKIGKITRSIIWQNSTLAMVVKVVVLRYGKQLLLMWSGFICYIKCGANSENEILIFHRIGRYSKC